MSARIKLNVTKLVQADARIAAWELMSPGPQQAAVNPFAIEIAGWILPYQNGLQHLRIVRGSDEIARVPCRGGSPAAQRYAERIRYAGLGVGAKGRYLARRLLNGRPFKVVSRWAPASLRTTAPPPNTSFHTSVPLLGLPCQGVLHLEAVTPNSSVRLCEIAYERAPLPQNHSDSTGELRPLSVTAIGRTGSSWLMHVLAQHPQIRALPLYPYEATPARDILQACVEGFGEGLFRENMHRAVLEVAAKLQLPAEAAGVVAAIDEVANELRQRGVDALRGAIRCVERYYLALCARPATPEGQARAGVEYYVEKNMRPQRLFQELCPGAKELFLVRDFRDVICSSLAFNAKRSFVGFGREDVASDREFIWHRAAMARPWILEPWQERAGRAHLVKYETLIQHPHACLQPLLEYLELDSSERMIDRMLEDARRKQNVLTNHVTASDVSQSVGRWVRDMDRDLQKECESAFQEFFAAFGYTT